VVRTTPARPTFPSRDFDASQAAGAAADDSGVQPRPSRGGSRDSGGGGRASEPCRRRPPSRTPCAPALRPGPGGRRQVQGGPAGHHEPRGRRPRGRAAADRLRQRHLLRPRRLDGEGRHRGLPPEAAGGPRRRRRARRRARRNEFVFYDGPPFANGLPHYGHLLTGFVKDAVPRYRRCAASGSSGASAGTATACPPRSRPRRSWASPGHPGDHRVRHRAFNDACRTSVLRYTDEWEDYVTRQARWVDFDNDYKTLDLDYMESVMWAFKSLWDKGSSTRASGCWRTAGGARRRSATPRPGWTTSTATGRTRPSPCGSSSRPASGSWPGRPRRGRCRRTSRSPSDPTSSTP
jgi:hypothetical protein